MNNKMEIFTLCKSGEGAGVITNFHNQDNGMLGGSVRITIAKTDSGNASFSFNLSEWAGISQNFKTATIVEGMKLVNPVSQSTNNKNSIAYTKKITNTGKTAAEILIEQGDAGVDLLCKQHEFLEKNLSKFPKNEEQMQAIMLGISLFKNGELDKEVTGQGCDTTIELYKNLKGSMQSPMPEDNSKFLCSSGTIQYSLDGKNYPVKLSIQNFYAPIYKQENGSQIIDAKNLVPGTKKSLDYNISRADFSAMLDAVETAKQIYICGNAKELLNIKEKTKQEVKSEFGQEAKEFFITNVEPLKEYEKLYSCKVHIADGEELPDEMTLRIWKTSKNLEWVQKFLEASKNGNYSFMIKAKVRDENLDFVERVK